MKRTRKQNDLPRAPEAERALLASLMALPAAADHPAVAALVPDDFVDPQYRVIFRHLIGIRVDGLSPEVLATRLHAHGEYDAAKPALLELLKENVSGADAVYYAERVREAGRKRRLAIRFGELAVAALNGSAADDVLASARAALASIDAGAIRKRFNFISSAEFAAAVFTETYLVQDVLVAGEPAVCGGRTKTLKTTLLVDLGLSVGTGTPFLGKFATQKARVCIMSGESGKRTLQQTAKRISASKGFDLAAADVRWEFTLPRLADPSDVMAIRAAIEYHRAKVLILDPAYLCLFAGDAGGRQASNVFDTGGLLAQLSLLGQQTGATIVICHHCRKGGAGAAAYDPPELEDLSQAGFAEWARQWLLLGRRERYELGSGQHKLWLVSGGSAGHSGLHAVDVDESGHDWTVTVSTPGEAQATAAEQRVEGDVQKLLTAAARFPDGETKSQLRSESGLNSPRATEALAVALQTGQLVECELFKSGKRTPITGYRLPESEF